jgi:hypothetical protein
MRYTRNTIRYISNAGGRDGIFFLPLSISPFLTHQVPTGLLLPRIIGNFQRFFKYSKYGPISKIFFLKFPNLPNFHPPQRKQLECTGRGRQLIANATRVKKTDTGEGELLR